MLASHFFGRPAIAEIIECERFASHPLWTLQWVWMSVIGKVSGAKDHHPIEDWQYLRLTTGHIPVPEFEVATIFLLPILVQIQEQIEPAVESILAMLVEIRMHPKFASPHYLMKTSAIKTRVGYQIVYTG